MEKIIVFFSLLSVFFLLNPKSINALEIAGASAMVKEESQINYEYDDRVQTLQSFLEDQNSPLANYSQNLIETADKHALDWRLIPAITGIESSFGKSMPQNSFNAYGWNNGKTKFDSWEESFEKVASTLKQKYIDRGLNTPEKIGRVYAPPSTTWAIKVRFFMQKISQNNETFLQLSI